MKEGTDVYGWTTFGIWFFFLFVGVYGLYVIYFNLGTGDVDRIQNGLGMSMGILVAFTMANLRRMNEIADLEKEMEKLKKAKEVEE